MKYIKKINEFRNQLEIPFDGKHPLHDKPTHIHIRDAFEKLSKETNIKIEDFDSDVSSYDIQNKWDELKDKVIDTLITDNEDNREVEIAYYFFSNYDLIEYKDYFSDELKQYIDDNPDESSDDIIENFSLYDGDTLSDYMLKDKLDEIAKEYYMIKLDDNPILYDIEQDDDNLISVYRELTYDKENEKDVYDNIMKYNGVGVFWSYSENGAEAHSGGRGDTYVLYGKVRPEDIDWEQTIYKSAYSLSEEKEIELKDEVPVLLEKVIFKDENIDILEDEIIIKT